MDHGYLICGVTSVDHKQARSGERYPGSVCHYSIEVRRDFEAVELGVASNSRVHIIDLRDGRIADVETVG